MTTKRHGKKVARELPPAGTTLQGRFRGENYSATIVEAEGLRVGRGVKFGEDIYPSLSTAARTITKQSVNGWRFCQAAKQLERLQRRADRATFLAFSPTSAASSLDFILHQSDEVHAYHD
jgi:hypothetical protein